jgi:hypothetical protein
LVLVVRLSRADAKDIAQQKQGQVVIGRGFALEWAFSPIEALKGGKEVFPALLAVGRNVESTVS